MEIVSRKDVWFLTIDPILNDEIGRDLATSWQRVRPAILAALDKNLTSKDAHWANVCVFMCTGRFSPKMRYPTILINMLYPAKADWARGANAIKEIISEQGGHCPSIEFVYGSLNTSAPFRFSSPEINHEHISPGKPLDLNDIKKRTLGGDSIGILNSDGSGSVGGCILLDDPSHKLRPRLCLLTCHHVVATADKKANTEVFKQHLALRSMKSSRTAAYAQMQSPSKEDYERIFHHITDEIEKFQNSHDVMLKQNGGELEFVIPHQRSAFLSIQASLTMLKRRLTLLLSKEKPIGSVIASSGIRIAEFVEGEGKAVQRKMDWAIVEFEDEA